MRTVTRGIVLVGTALGAATGVLGAQQQQGAHVDAAKAAPMPAYRYRLLGVYDEQSGDPIEGVEVLDVLSGNSVLTTPTGTVTLAFLPDGGSLVRLRKLGYGVQTFAVAITPSDTAPLTVVMTKAQTLEKVVVTDSASRYISPNLRAFEERKREGFGHFIDEAEMRKADNRTMANLLISKIPGLTETPGPLGAQYIASSRKMCSGPALRRCMQADCYPSVFIDGVKIYDHAMRIAPPDYGKMSPIEYAAIEYYAGGASLPMDISATNSDCGVLLFWSRER